MENNFPKTLKSLLKQKKTTHAQLAKLLGLQTQNISMYITGKARPNIDSLIKIASHFGVSLDYLITGLNTENKVLSSELGLSERALQTLKELANKVHGENLFGLSHELDKLISDPDFLQTYFQALCEYQRNAKIYPAVKESLEAQGVEAVPESYMDMVESKAAEKLYGYFRRLFKRNNITRDMYKDNNSHAMKLMLDSLKKALNNCQYNEQTRES